VSARKRFAAAAMITGIIAGGVALAAPANAIQVAGCNNNTSNLVATNGVCFGFADPGAMNPHLNNIYQADGGVMSGYVKGTDGLQHTFSVGGSDNFQATTITEMCIQPSSECW